MAFDPITPCTPGELVDKYKCVACLSEKDMWAVVAYAMAQVSRTYQNDMAKLLEDSACLTCLSDRQIFGAIVAMIANMGMGDVPIDEVKENIKCFLCATPKQLKAAMLFLFCNYFQEEITPAQ